MESKSSSTTSTTQSKTDAITRRCSDCLCVDLCVFRFGKFWSIKSRNGKGCTYPLTETNEPPPRQKTKQETPKLSETKNPKQKPRTYVQNDLFNTKPAELTDEDY